MDTFQAMSNYTEYTVAFTKIDYNSKFRRGEK